ncbi:Fic family protein [Labilibaculum sp. A4]|uniref:Fic family protein n=1 Tax=Labilibaculum euxinus TaxID=2686357 RepID=A0A425Y247_9BACT|nr:Fic family protein [Labilibaculum euxinus]MDQ1772613.1 Fic family protein [Labilibaculum euxinus]MUP37631.1 Fic family protein [Labilibaculum euxinus]MVB06836.1 Fic family protein [Labilibaculum euxinus]MWN78384.1 Fic family protein [Labilibaculum euxinus]
MSVKLNKKTGGDFVYQSFKEGYKSVTPSLINRSFEWNDKQINILLESAMLELGELNAYSKFFPGIDNHIPLFIAQEVIASNLIEGNKSDLYQVFVPDVSQSFKSQYAQKEIVNHIKAIHWGVNELQKFPLSVRLVKEAHKILCSDLPAKEEFGGKLRSFFHAHENSFEEESNYSPPNKHELKILINDGKKFWRNDDLELPQLIKMAISLYQFENILPFLDGNGRTARILILFETISLKFVARPIFCLSVFFEKNRLEYYHRLNLIRSKNDIEQWIKFVLTGVKETALHSKNLLGNVEGLTKYYESVIEEKMSKKRKQSAKQLLSEFYSNPFMSVSDVKEKLQLSFQSANLLVKEFETHNILKEYAGARRNRVFYLWEYLNLFEL